MMKDFGFEVENMRLKDTDRLKALNNELTKLGAKVIETDRLNISILKVGKEFKVKTFEL